MNSSETDYSLSELDIQYVFVKRYYQSYEPIILAKGVPIGSLAEQHLKKTANRDGVILRDQECSYCCDVSDKTRICADCDLVLCLDCDGSLHSKISYRSHDRFDLVDFCTLLKIKIVPAVESQPESPTERLQAPPDEEVVPRNNDIISDEKEVLSAEDLVKMAEAFQASIDASTSTTEFSRLLAAILCRDGITLASSETSLLKQTGAFAQTLFEERQDLIASVHAFISASNKRFSNAIIRAALVCSFFDVKLAAQQLLTMRTQSIDCVAESMSVDNFSASNDPSCLISKKACDDATLLDRNRERAGQLLDQFYETDQLQPNLKQPDIDSGRKVVVNFQFDQLDEAAAIDSAISSINFQKIQDFFASMNREWQNRRKLKPGDMLQLVLKHEKLSRDQKERILTAERQNAAFGKLLCNRSDLWKLILIQLAEVWCLAICVSTQRADAQLLDVMTIEQKRMTAMESDIISSFCTLKRIDRKSLFEKISMITADDILGAASEDTLDEALTFLFRECPLCLEFVPPSQQTTIYLCNCNVCRSCFAQFFTERVRDHDVSNWTCPVCSFKFEDDDQISKQLFFLNEALKPVVDSNVMDLFQHKQVAWAMPRDPAFRHCIRCENGWLVVISKAELEAKNEVTIGKLIHCPQQKCGAAMCFWCKREWKPAHDKVSCKDFVRWLEINNPEALQRGLDQILAFNSVKCPKCNDVRIQDRGGCMHMKCVQCHFQFCTFCCQEFFSSSEKCYTCKNLKPRRQGAQGLHAHHPRTCPYYIRDEPIVALERLLHNAQVSEEMLRDYTMRFVATARAEHNNPNSCIVRVQSEKKVDVACGKELAQQPIPKEALLCSDCYTINVLGKYIYSSKIDPAEILSIPRLKNLLQTANINLPAEPQQILTKNGLPDESLPDAQSYKKQLVKLVRDCLPLK